MAYLETGNASEAYRRAYQPKKMSVKAITVESTRLLQHPSITLAVQGGRQAIRDRHEITRDDIAKMLIDTQARAFKTGQCSAAVSAAMGLAKLLGHIVDKHELGGKDGKDLVPPVPPSIRLTITRTMKAAV